MKNKDKIMVIALAFLAFFLRLADFGLGIGEIVPAFLGTAVVVTVYFLVREALNGKDNPVAFLTSLLLTINPWHILVSRQFWDFNLVLLAVALGVWFILAQKGNQIFSRLGMTAVAPFFRERFFVFTLLERYLANFSGGFLFFHGDWFFPGKTLSSQGVMYLPDIVFLLLGLGVLLAKKRNRFENIILFWLFLSPLPSLFWSKTPLSLTSFGLVIPLVFITAEGINELVQVLKKNTQPVKAFAYSLLVGAYGFFLCRFIDLAFWH